MKTSACVKQSKVADYRLHVSLIKKFSWKKNEKINTQNKIVTKLNKFLFS